MKSTLEKIAGRFREDPPWALLLASAFLAMLSMPLARMAIALSLVATLASKPTRRRLALTQPTLGWLVYLALAATVTSIAAATNTDPLLVPSKGLSKLPKLFWYVAIPLTAANVTSPARFRRLLGALVLGGLLFAIYTIAFGTAFAWLQVYFPPARAPDATPAAARWLHSAASAAGLDSAIDRWLSDDVWLHFGSRRPPCFLYALTFNATLHAAQRLMVALVCATVFLFADHPGAGADSSRGRRLLRLAVPVAIAAALVLTCKRGPLAAGVVSVGILVAVLSKPLKALAAILAICALAMAIPQSRARIARIPAEIEVKAGGRTMMWTRIAPALHREHPWGIGFRALTARKMRSIERHVEPNRTHLHCTPLQAFVDFGWPGLAAWALWMSLAFKCAIATARGRLGAAQLDPALRLAPAAALFALFLVSLIEYNLADAAVVILYGHVLGLSSPRFIAGDATSRS